jgi:hypothetical protein
VSIARSAARAVALFAILPAVVSGQGKTNQYGYPEKLPPRPTSAEVSAADLMTRLYIFADDSMEGRQSGRVGNMRGTNYIAGELKRMGIEPGGDNGSYFQTLPYVQRRFTDRSTLSVNGKALRFNQDFAPIPTGITSAPAPINNVPVVYGGVAGDTAAMITTEQAAGKFVILSVRPGTAPAAGGRFGGGNAWMTRFAGAAGVAQVNLDDLPVAARAALNDPPATFAAADAQRTVVAGDVVVNNGEMVGIVRNGGLISGALPSGVTVTIAQRYADSLRTADSLARAEQVARMQQQSGARSTTGPMNAQPVVLPPQFRITNSAAAQLLGRPLEGAALGTTGASVSAALDFESRQTDYGRNVVGIIRGSDAQLKGQFVAIGAHNDHVGFRASGVDHDSARAAASQRLRLQMSSGDLRALTAEQAASVTVNVDSLRKIRPARRDSINNGADDDGSGSMAVLEIAEAIQAMPVKPKRSVVFVWHTAEESGMHGSRHFSSNPSVPVDSIVTAINLDMIGRGRAEDVIGGGDTYVGVLGANRLSRHLGAMVDGVNARQPQPLKMDARFDDPTIGTAVNGVVSWPGYQNLYGRSDHTRYAEKCIPIVFFFTGLHGDYHQITDEAQYIDYPHYARITGYVKDLLLEIGNNRQRPALDAGMCVRR